MRPLLKTLAALSAFLCLATLITWPLSSSRVPDPTPIRRTLQIEPTSHGLRLIHAARNHPKSFTWFIGSNLMEPDGKHRKITPEGDLHGFPDGSARTVPTQPATFAGLRWEHGAATDGPKSIDDDFKLWLIPWRALTIPYPALALLTATPPIPLPPPRHPIEASHLPRPLPNLRLRPPRQHRPLPRVRHALSLLES